MLILTSLFLYIYIYIYIYIYKKREVNAEKINIIVMFFGLLFQKFAPAKSNRC